MLAADKLYLEGKLARGVTRLKWKEFSLHHLNLTTVSTQASVLAGFGFAALLGPILSTYLLSKGGYPLVFTTLSLMSALSFILCRLFL